MEATKVKLTLMIDKKANKVLFAEAEKDFADFLFNLLSLPIATVIRLFKNASMFGCIENMYHSLEILNKAYLQPNLDKNKLLKPHVTAPALLAPRLLPGANNSPHMNKKLMYKCESHRYVTDVENTHSPCCFCSMNHYMRFVESNVECIVKNLVTYMVTDDLSVAPVSIISGVDLLQHNVKDIGALEKRVVELGTDEGLALLKNSLHPKTALTDVFLIKKEHKDVVVSSLIN